MWIAIFIMVIIAMLLSFVYLINKLRKFGIFKKIANNNNYVSYFLGLTVILISAVIISFVINFVNCIICFIHLVIIWLICDLVCFIIKKFRKKDFQRYYSGIAAVVITAGYLCVGWYFAHHVTPTNYIIKTDKNVGELRIVQFADSHIGATFDADKFAEYVDEMQGQNPDVVLITGDFVDDDTSREDMIESCNALGRLNPTYGVYYSYGNHDKGYFSEEARGWNNDELVSELTKNGVVILEDEAVLIGDRFYIVGRQDRSEIEKGYTRADMSELTSELDKDKYIIVMDHQPNDYDAQAESGVDLVLSGHTHGGQFFPINNAGVWIGANDFTYGHEKRGDTDFIVTSGIGDWSIKFKTGCIAEYVVIDIK